MDFVTHFESPEGEKLPIAASTLVTVEIPAAGSADKGGWHQAAESVTEHYNQQAGYNAPKSSAVIPHCTDPSVFTDHGLRIDYEEQLDGWVLWIDSLPENACTLTLLFINHSTEGTPCALPALGGGGVKVIDLSSDSYAVGSSSLGEAIVYMILGGGCNKAESALIEKVLSEAKSAIDKGQTVKFKFSTKDYAMSCESMLLNVGYQNGALVQLSANGGMLYGGVVVNFELCFAHEDNLVVNSTFTPPTTA